MIFDFQNLFLDTVVTFPDWAYSNTPSTGPFVETSSVEGSPITATAVTGTIQVQ